MNQHAILLSDEGPSAKLVKAKDGESLLDFCYRMIGCSCIEIVHPKGLERPYLLVIDEEGSFASEPKLNIIASMWYGTAEHNQPIVGKVLVMKEILTDEGPDIGFLSEIEAAKLGSQPIKIPMSLMLGFLGKGD